MGRKAEKGIKYYQMKVGHNTNAKIRLLFNEFDSHGYWIWSCLIDKIYEDEGYFFDYNNEDELELFATDVCKKQVPLVKEVIARCVKRSLFDQGVFDSFGVLTSDRIQLQYLEATAERRRKGTEIEIVENYLVIPFNLEDKEWKNVKLIVVNPIKSLEQNNSSKEQSDKSKEESAKDKRRKDKRIEPNGSPGFQPDTTNQELLKEYLGIPDKDKRSIIKFIQANKPLFHEPFIDLWNHYAGERGLAKVSVVNDKRKKKFKVRIRERPFDFIEILSKAKESDFLMSNSFFCFDWIIENDSNYLKVLEGAYANEKKNTASNGTEQTTDAAAERIERQILKQQEQT